MPLPEVESGNDEPLYNIGVVSRMTGVTMATLRAWERRYEFPELRRTSGGHRLYSERDILQLKWVKERTDEGMQVSQSIAALRHQEQTGRLVISGEGQHAERLTLIESGQTREGLSFTIAHAESLYAALLRRDTSRSDDVLNEALAMISPEEVILGVISPVLNRIGEGWERGELSISTEHLATNYLRQRLLMWMLNSPPAVKIAPILLACAPEEWHEGSLLVFGAILRRRSWPVAYLGQAVPLQDLASFIRELKPNLVINVAMTETTATLLADWPHWMPDIFQSGKPVMAYGGRVFSREPAWRLRVQGTYLGDTLREGLDSIETLMKTV